MRLRSFWGRLLTTFCLSCSAYALPVQDLSSLPHQVENFLKQQLNNPGVTRVEISVKRPDPRLRLKQCDRELTLRNKTRNLLAGNMTIQVACEGSSPWSFFLTAQVKQWGTIVTANRDLDKGMTLSAADLTSAEYELARLGHGFYRDQNSVVGMAVKRRIAKGSPIRTASLTPPRMVTKGDQVTIIASNGAVSVRIAGVAMSHGKHGEQIRVKNSHSERVIKARVSGKGTVTVLM